MLACRIGGRNDVSRRQVGQLNTAAVEESRPGNEQRIRPLTHNRCERLVYLGAAAYFENPNALTHDPGSRLQLPQCRPERSRRWIKEGGYLRCAGDQLTQQFEPLRGHLRLK